MFRGEHHGTTPRPCRKVEQKQQPALARTHGRGQLNVSWTRSLRNLEDLAAFDDGQCDFTKYGSGL